jgi:hypothetical protein
MSRENFNAANKLERQYLTEFFINSEVPYFEFTEGYTRHDAMITGLTGNVMMIEAKVRKIDSDRYNDTIIEKSKIDYMLEQTKGTNITPMLTIFFDDGFVFIKTIEQYEVLDIITVYAPKETNGDTTKVPKEMILFKIDKHQLHKYK